MLGLLVILGWNIYAVTGCSYPAVPAHSSITISDSRLTSGTVAKYTCDSGYDLIGSNTRICQANGQWSEELPVCGINIALGKPSRQSSIDGRGMPQAAVDGRPARLPFFDNCARTQAQSFPWWFTNLLDRQQISYVQLTFGASCCVDGGVAFLEVRIGDNMDAQNNPLCVTFAERIELGQIVTLKCNEPLNGTFLSIHLKNAKNNILSLCEVAAYSTTAISKFNCPIFSNETSKHLEAFNHNCYTFYNDHTLSWNEAKDYCKKRNGHLIYGSNPGLQGFISWEIAKTENDGNGITNYWMGLTRNIENGQWLWINNDTTVYTFWAVPLNNQNPRNENKNCASFNRNSGWLWADTDCNQKMNWICQYEPNICGNPDRLENTTISYKSLTKGSIATYECPSGKILWGSRTRTCLPDGKWSGSPPNCIHVDCGQPKFLANGVVYLRNGNTDFNSVAEYSCKNGFILSGKKETICQSTGLWSGIPPICEALVCSSLPSIENGWITVNRETRDEGISVSYSCEANYVLNGIPTRRCFVNGSWEGIAPRCVVADATTVTQIDIFNLPTGRVEFSPVDNPNLLYNISSFSTSKNNFSIPLNKSSTETPDVAIAGVMDLDTFNSKMREKNIGGYIAIGVVGGLAIIIAVTVIIVFCICRSPKKKSSKGSTDSTDMSSFDSSSSDSDSNRLFHYYKRAWENLRLEHEKQPKNNFEVLRTSPKLSEISADDSKTRPKQMVNTLDVKREKVGPFHYFGGGKETIEHIRDSGEVVINPDIQAMYINPKDKKFRAQRERHSPESFYQNDRPFSTFKHKGYP